MSCDLFLKEMKNFDGRVATCQMKRPKYQTLTQRHPVRSEHRWVSGWPTPCVDHLEGQGAATIFRTVLVVTGIHLYMPYILYSNYPTLCCRRHISNRHSCAPIKLYL